MPIFLRRWTLSARIVLALLVGFVLWNRAFLFILIGPPSFFVPYYGLTTELAGVVLTTWGICVAIAFPLWIHSLLADEPEAASADAEIPLARFPVLQAEVSTIARTASRPGPEAVRLETPDLAETFALIPKQFAVFPDPRCLRLPAGPLILWSVLDLRSYILHSLLCPRPNKWLLRLAEGQMQTFAPIVLGAMAGNNDTPIMRGYLWEVGTLNQLLLEWKLLADIETDRKIAVRYGQDAAASWMHRLWLGQREFPSYWHRFVVSSAECGVVPPFLTGFREAISTGKFEAPTLPRPTDSDGSGDGVNENPEAPLDGDLMNLAVRMEVLFANSANHAVSDPRPASDLLGDAPDVESMLATRALETDGDACEGITLAGLEPIPWDLFPSRVLIPAMERDLARNPEIFAGKTLDDLPSIAEGRDRYAPALTDEQGSLSRPDQKHETLPAYLESFLAVELLRRGWQLEFSPSDGVRLASPVQERKIDPEFVVRGLIEGSLNEPEFRQLAGLADQTA